jgi:hypothetical protein
MREADMSCKCKATTYQEHLREVEEGRYAGHVYKGHHWAPTGDDDNTK